jgi:hypothetical protein
MWIRKDANDLGDDVRREWRARIKSFVGWVFGGCRAEEADRTTMRSSRRVEAAA